MKMLFVVATGDPVPFEGDPTRTIGAKPQEIERTLYWARRLAHGELRVVEPAPVTPTPGTAGEGKVS